MPDWSRKLSSVVETRDGKKIATLAQARAFVLKQKRDIPWHWVAGELLAAANGGAVELEAATKAVRQGLFLDGMRLRL